MIRYSYGIMLGICLLFFWTYTQAQTLAFPGAEGFGRFAKGGRGGRVIEVTNLNAAGPGSFRACLEASGPRTCVFRVGGIIDMNETHIIITNPFLTIAGQTAPGDGILVKGALLEIRTHDVIVRHLRARPGLISDPGAAYSWNALVPSYNSNNVIVDHCSFSWATDDTIGAWDATNVTFQWCIIAEGLNSSQYGKGALIGWSTNVSLLKNLFAHHRDRAPYVQSGDMQMVNNVVYNIRGNANIAPVSATIKAEFIANYFLQGPDSSGYWYTSIRNLGPCWGSPNCDWLDPTYVTGTSIYLKDNYHNTLRPNNSYPEDSLVQQGMGDDGYPTSSTPFGFPVIQSQTDALQAKVDVLARAGATVPKRSPVDARVINDVKNGTGTINFTGIPGGGYPSIPFVSQSVDYDTDHDGMPNSWELSHGLNPNDASDGPQTATNGYTHLENYLNELAGDPISGSDYPVPSRLNPPILRVLIVSD